MISAVDAVIAGELADVAGELAVVAAKPADLEAHLVAGDPGGGLHMGGVAEDEHALAREVGRIDRPRIPRQPQARGIGRARHAGQGADFGDEVMRGADADRHDLRPGHIEVALEEARRRFARLGVEKHVEMRRRQSGDVGWRGAHRRDHVHADAQVVEERREFLDIVAVTEAEARGAKDVRGDLRRLLLRLAEMPADLEEGLVRAEVLLPLVGRKFQRDDRHGKTHGLGQTARIVLDQLGRAGGADDDRFGLEAVVGVLAGGLEEMRGVRPEIAGLKGRVGHRRAMVAPLDHREEKVGVGVALRGVQDVVQPLHAGRDAHGADVRRAFVCPDRQLHATAPIFSFPRRRSGREKSPARSPACS